MTELKVQRRGCVLVVDDEARNRKLMRRFLEPSWEVCEAASGPEAIEVLRTSNVDLVLLDVMMPGQDGLETCRIIRTQRPKEFLPVILVTGLCGQEDKNRGLEAGADDFLGKPIDRRELVLRVGNFLRLREQEQVIAAKIVEVQRLQALKDDLVSLLVHDLRNPLAGLLSSLELALDGATGDQLREDLQRASAMAETLRGALDEMLQVRLLEENAVVAHRANHDLGAIVRAAAATFEPVARRRRLELRVTTEGEEMAAVDARLLQRSLENLLSNALKYTSAGTQVDVELRSHAGTVQLEVSDRGPGIPDALKGVLFERFGSVEAQRGKQRRGVGLGLYFVKLAAEAHGGSVSVHDRPGGGALFRLQLAAATAPAGERAA